MLSALAKHATHKTLVVIIFAVYLGILTCLMRVQTSTVLEQQLRNMWKRIKRPRPHRMRTMFLFPWPHQANEFEKFLYYTMDKPPTDRPLAVKRSVSLSNTMCFGYTSLHPELHFDRFRRFCTAQPRDKETGWMTLHATRSSVAIGCMMQ